MRLLDAFCGAGGCSVGYARAGFDVTGVDIEPHADYPFELVVADALDVLTDRAFLGGFDAIHASPPCQSYSAMSACRPGLSETYPALIEELRDKLAATGKPYIIENVVGAPLASSSDMFGAHGAMLCGRMFGLKLYRHRVFETSFPVWAPHHPLHDVPASRAGHWQPGTVISVSGNCSPIAVARKAMGIDWMNRDELGEAIPPAYCELIGQQLLASLRSDDGELHDSWREHTLDSAASPDRKTGSRLSTGAPLGSESCANSYQSASAVNAANSLRLDRGPDAQD